jgi:hypothetical protein
MHNAACSVLRAVLRRSVSFLLFYLLLVTAASFAQAQSGRRIPKQPGSTERNSPSQPEPPVQQPTPTQTAPRLPILAVKNLQTIGGSSIFADIALEGCLEELKQSAAVQVSSGKDKNRKEASDYAKASKETYVVLIQLESSRRARARSRPRGISIKDKVADPLAFPFLARQLHSTTS